MLHSTLLALVVAWMSTTDASLPTCDSTGVKELVQQTFRDTLAKNSGNAVDVAASHIDMSDIKQLSEAQDKRVCTVHTQFVVAPKAGAADGAAAAAKVAEGWRFKTVDFAVTPSATAGNVVVEITRAE